MDLPINLYADIATADKKSLSTEDVLYDAGVCLSFRKNFFEIYFPVVMSKNIQDYQKANNISYLESIRFTLNLNLINPFGLIRNFSM